MATEEKEILQDVEEANEPVKTEADSKHKKEKKKKETIEDKIEKIEEELQSVKDKYLRTLAEMENVKKRLTEDLKRERKYQSMPVSDKLIDAIEVFDQALNVETDDPNFKNFLYGFKMIKDMIFNPLVEEGVKVIETKVGDYFDPNTEHAFDTTYDPALQENQIVKVVKKGYMFKDRLLRPAMVIINKSPESEVVEETEQENQNLNENIA